VEKTLFESVKIGLQLRSFHGNIMLQSIYERGAVMAALSVRRRGLEGYLYRSLKYPGLVETWPKVPDVRAALLKNGRQLWSILHPPVTS
jgi:hypothetical protein